MKYVFFGTPEFAAIILKRLIEADMAPVAVICNPDKPVGRKRVLTPPPVKVIALENGIEVYQPADKEQLRTLTPKLSEKADFGLVAAYARIIPQEVIEAFKLGIVGVHPSLLPKHRGPSPIQFAILAGDEKTGTSLFMIEAGVDSGPILAQSEVDLGSKYYTDLLGELAELSADLLIDTLPKFVKGKVSPVAQSDAQATHTEFFNTEDAEVKQTDLDKALKGDKVRSQKIERLVRALNPEPGVFSMIDGKRIKLLRAHLEGEKLVLEEIQKEGKLPQNYS